MNSDFDVAVIGGGLVGSALAATLARSRLQVALCERRPIAHLHIPDDTGRAFALSVGSSNLLQAVLSRDVLAGNGQPINEVRVSEGLPGQGARPWVLEFKAADIGCENFGYMIGEGFLQHEINHVVGGLELVQRLAPVQIARTEVKAARLILYSSCGAELTAKCAIACDGPGRALAKANGFRFYRKDYCQGAVTCTVRHEHPHDGIAHQFFMPSGPIAILPLPGDHSSVVWTETLDRARHLSTLSDADFLAELLPAFGEFLGRLKLAGCRRNWPLSVSFSRRLCDERLALAGDSARQIHPLAGQGLNYGLRDVAALAEILVQAMRRGEDIGSTNVLERYERWRRFDSMTIVTATDCFNWLYSSNSHGLELLRSAGSTVISHLPLLRRAILRHAAGMSGDVPKLLRGEMP